MAGIDADYTLCEEVIKVVGLSSAEIMFSWLHNMSRARSRCTPLFP